MNIESLSEMLTQLTNRFFDWATSPAFYSQLGLVVLAVSVAFSVVAIVKRFSPVLQSEPKPGPLKFLRKGIYQFRELLFPLFVILSLAVTVDLSEYLIKQSAFVRACEGLAVVLMIYSVLSRFVNNVFLRSLIKWIAIPIAILQVVGLLDNDNESD